MRVRELAISAVVVVGVWASVGSGGSSSSSTDTTSQGSDTPTTAAPADAHIGTAAADGKFTFTLHSVRCGIPSVGDTTYGLGETAQGQFCEVKLRVANTGTESQDFMSSEQKAFDSAGNQVDNNDMAEIAAGIDQNMFSGINPGNAIETTLYYDIAKGRTISKFEFHDSMFSDGVTVLNQ